MNSNLQTIEVIKRVSLAKICMGLILAVAISFSFKANASASSQQSNTGVKLTQAKPQKKATVRLQKLYAHLPQPDDLGFVFDSAAKKHGIDAKLLVSVCVSESHLRKRVVNRGAVGMCQVIPRYHATTKSDMMNYRKNVDKAAEILADLKKTCRNNVRCIVHSYNVGKYAYKRGVRSPQYYAKVMKQYHRTV